ncbi:MULTISPECIES: hypothetical protein [unclassified Pseudomonas]|uniref:COG4648 family protein n=1 Tax=unclassified Pseudomonas TaxID=196821 RepID=UPI000BC87D45|nr:MULTISPECIES: hypothetical protein [unclassified Pseudomonas]PVZ15489.1 putative membrane protein [Pseudomonas sp. URIL14HWK12:I12]PVZ24863.1 putative membrane protein [Pseudomonas sp. URIL14HWK12:I10]PVZ34709.1 putative membrane protein [Pseudomonas sp. URIL14HWK12:I11]SNZ09032.1 Uncharacterized membrane protein [Pseudomonas sp. URIL14HWK12:I9]
MSRLIGAVLVLAGLLYPLAVHFGEGRIAPWQFGLLLGALWLARAVSSGGNRWLAVAALLFCAVLALAGDPQLLRWYPVLLSGALLALFGASLIRGMPVAERLARLSEPELPPRAVRYTRQVTWVWCLFFLLNGLVTAALTLWAPLAWWTLYTGLIAYLLMGALFAAEWLVRRRVRAAA